MHSCWGRTLRGQSWLLDDPHKSGNIKRRRIAVSSENYVPGVGIISSIACQHLDLNLHCVRESCTYILQFIYKAVFMRYLPDSWLGSPCKWWWMLCFGLLWPQDQEEDRDAVLCRMTSILDRQTVAVAPDELGIRSSLQTGSSNTLW
jgi:hypothetical protein